MADKLVKSVGITKKVDTKDAEVQCEDDEISP